MVIILSTPSVIGRFTAISSITLTSKPLRSATRCSKLSLKSISPRMARSVISRTSRPTPARSASSSITSVVISVESISKHIRRRERRKIPSFWNEISTSPFLASSMSARWKCPLSESVPRTENSMLVFGARSSSSRGMRPVRRFMSSMFSPSSDIARVTFEICSAVILRPTIVIIYRFLP